MLSIKTYYPSKGEQKQKKVNVQKGGGPEKVQQACEKVMYKMWTREIQLKKA